MNKRQKKKHMTRYGRVFKRFYIIKDLMLPRAWVNLFVKILIDVGEIPTKRRNKLVHMFRRKYFYTYEQQNDLIDNYRSWDSVQFRYQLKMQKRMTRSKRKELKRITLELKRVAERCNYAFSSVPNEVCLLTKKCDEIREVITDFFQHKNYKVVDVKIVPDEIKNGSFNGSVTLTPRFPVFNIVHDRNRKEDLNEKDTNIIQEKLSES